MKTIQIFILVLAGILLFGCSNGAQFDKKTADSADNLAAVEAADSLSNPENGAAQELSDNLSLILGDSSGSLSSGGSPDSNSAQLTLSDTSEVQTSSVTIIYSNELDTNFIWDTVSESYKRTITNLTIIKPNFTGTIDQVNVELKFFTSLDATGTPVQLDSGKPKNLANNQNIHSMKYSRTYTGTLTHVYRNITRNISVTTSLIITGINDGIDGVLVSGTRTENVNVVNGNITGVWTLIHTFNNVNVDRDIVDGVRITTYQGTANVSFNGTWVGPKGTKTVTKTAIITFNRERIVTVTIDGSTVTVDITTGNIK
jgi:hypothetical protein